MKRRSNQPLAAVLLALMLVLAIARTGFADAQSAGDDMPASGGQGHLWFVIGSASRSSGYDLCHHADDMNGPFFKPQGWLAQAPAAMTSWGNRVWMVMEPKMGPAETRREVFTLEVLRNDAFGIYYSVPSGRLDLAPPLPGLGMLASCVGTARGPVALLLPTQSAASGILASPTAQASEPDLQKPRLLQLDHDQWNERDLPDGFNGKQPCVLATAGSEGDDLIILCASPEGASRCLKYERGDDGKWASTLVDLDLKHVRSTANIEGQAALVMARGSPGEVRVEYLRQASTLPLMSFPRPSGRWSVEPGDGGLVLLERASDGKLHLRQIQPLAGTMSEQLAMSVQPISAKLWQMAVLLGASISALLLIFAVRPVRRGPVALPAKLAPLPLIQRIGAMLIDIVPGGLIAALALRSPISDLLQIPVVTLDLEQSGTYLLMVGLTVVQCTIFEIAKQTSLGKSMVGGQVVAVDGSRPTAGALVLRNFVKGIVLLVPPLAVFAALTHHLQGLPDLAAGTVVVHEAPPEAQEQPDDR